MTYLLFRWASSALCLIPFVLFLSQAQEQGSRQSYITGGVTGQFVYVRLLGNRPRVLTLCQVEVRYFDWQLHWWCWMRKKKRKKIGLKNTSWTWCNKSVLILWAIMLINSIIGVISAHKKIDNFHFNTLKHIIDILNIASTLAFIYLWESRSAKCEVMLQIFFWREPLAERCVETEGTSLNESLVQGNPGRNVGV